ncbi:S49 family peptidase [Zavarzinella formosa]|uniref:S49 family peptidase n=1 Tax=Zavarzinella formosa TaxID=360055 RepID=UPI0012F8907A|nr:S49 family peptidase [Zavarzinella formosa]
MRYFQLLMLMPFVAGCGQVFQARVGLDVPPLRVGVDLPPNSNQSPVTEMPLEGFAGVEKGPKVAVIDVEGILLNTNYTGPYATGDNPIDVFKEKLDAARSPSIAAVVLRINSPGGSVTASEVMWSELSRFKRETGKPVVACLMDQGCGGAYYIATACDKILAHPTTVVGGIGVILNLYNFQGTLNLAKVENLSIKAKDSPKIDLDYRLGVLNEDDKEMLIGMADDLHSQFKKVVKSSRPGLKSEATLFDGRVFLAGQAKERGLVDEVGHLPDAVNLARSLGNCPGTGVVMLHRTNDQARTAYATTPNTPLQVGLLGVSVPSGDRNKLPTFLYLWQPDPSMERLAGK